MKHNITETIEQLIDQSSLLDVLTAIECICGEKAAHLRANWQDRQSAKVWDKASNLVGETARRVDSLHI